MSFFDAISQLERIGKTRNELFDAIEKGRIEVRCESVETSTFIASTWVLEANGTRGIYVDPALFDLEAGFVSSDEVRLSPEGLSRMERPPYPWLFRSGIDFTLFICSREGNEKTGRIILDHDFLREAFLVPGSNDVLVDNIQIRKRRLAGNVTLDARAFAKLFGKPTIDLKRVFKGRPSYYSDETCDAEWIKWSRTNPRMSPIDQRKALREIYREKGHKVSKDNVQFRPERDKIVEIVASMPKKSKPK